MIPKAHFPRVRNSSQRSVSTDRFPSPLPIRSHFIAVIFLPFRLGLEYPVGWKAANLARRLAAFYRSLSDESQYPGGRFAIRILPI